MAEGLVMNWKRFFILALIFGMASLAAGCTTSYLEWAGKMANEKPARSVHGYQQPKQSAVLPLAALKK
jgi:hypothetical protein